MAKSKTSKIDFEKSLAELEQLVEEMESGELSLDQSLAKFEKGVSLTKLCQQALKDAEQRVNILLEKHGETSLEEFSNDSE
jgi:exodeoxyribonuclease VII small subunit